MAQCFLWWLLVNVSFTSHNFHSFNTICTDYNDFLFFFIWLGRALTDLFIPLTTPKKHCINLAPNDKSTSAQSLPFQIIA